MAQLLDKTRDGETQSSVNLVEQDVLLPMHPALPRLRSGRLRFAPAPTRRADGIADPVRRARRVDWVGRLFEAGWAALLLGCVGECLYRLLWAIQP